MLQLFKKRPDPLAAYRQAPSPLDRLLSLWLAFARAEGATAFVIGMPRDLPACVGAEDEAAFRRHLSAERPAAAPADDSAADRAFCASTQLKSPLGWQTVPVWVRINGDLYFHNGLPITAHLAFLSMIEKRLVSLDASEEHPKPIRYIEYDSDDPSQRRFAEVELLLDGDNTIRIEIVKHLCLPQSARAVPAVC